MQVCKYVCMYVSLSLYIYIYFVLSRPWRTLVLLSTSLCCFRSCRKIHTQAPTPSLHSYHPYSQFQSALYLLHFKTHHTERSPEDDMSSTMVRQRRKQVLFTLNVDVIVNYGLKQTGQEKLAISGQTILVLTAGSEMT